MAGRPYRRAQELLSNPQVLRSLRLQDILQLCFFCSRSSRARRNPDDPSQLLTASEYITKRYAFLTGKAKKHKHDEWQDGLHRALSSLLLRKKLVPGRHPGSLEEILLQLPRAEWDDLAEKELQRESILTFREQQKQKMRTESLSPDPENAAPGLRQDRAQADLAMHEAEGDIDIHPAHRLTNKEVKFLQAKQLVSYIPLLEPAKQFYLITLLSGSLNSFLKGDIAQAAYVVRQVDTQLEKHGAGVKTLSERERDTLQARKWRALQQQRDAEVLLALVASVDTKRAKGLPPGDIKLANGDPDFHRLETFYPGSKEVVEEAYAEIQASYLEPEPTSRIAGPWRRGPRLA